MTSRFPRVLTAGMFVLACGHTTSDSSTASNAEDRLARFPDDARAALTLGLAFEKRADLARAHLYLRQALESGAPADRTLSALVRVAVASGEHHSALGYARQYEQVVARTCVNARNCEALAEVRTVVAALQLGRGDTQAAQETLELALSAKSDHADALHLFRDLEARTALLSSP